MVGAPDIAEQRRVLVEAGWVEDESAGQIRAGGASALPNGTHVSVCRTVSSDPSKGERRPWFMKRHLDRPPREVATEVGHYVAINGRWVHTNLD